MYFSTVSYNEQDVQIAHLIAVAPTVSVDMPGVSGGRRRTVVVAVHPVGAVARVRLLTVVAGEEVEAAGLLG